MVITKTVVKLVLAVSAGIHLYFGLVFMLSPEAMMASLSIAATSPDGLTEMRTFYGGLMFAMGCFFALGIVDSTVTRAALLMMVLTYFAAVVVRSYGFAQSTPESNILWNIFYVEIAGLIGGLFALYCQNKVESKDCNQRGQSHFNLK